MYVSPFSILDTFVDICGQGWDKPYLFRDVYDKFVARHVSVNRTSWDNISKDVRYTDAPEENARWDDLLEHEKKSIDSFELCAEACRARDECLQWMWRQGDCRLGFDIRLGAIDQSEQESWSSGWMRARIDTMRDEMEPCVDHRNRTGLDVSSVPLTG